MQQQNKIKTSFDSAITGNPERAIQLEYLQVAANGAYAASTICGCNTRKYHGLLVAPQPQIDDGSHVLLAALDETLHCGDTAWQLSTHRYTGVYYPEGYRHITAFSSSPVPKWTFEAGHTILQKELLFAGGHNRLMIRYSLLQAKKAVTLRLMPLFAFRNAHTLCRRNEGAQRHTIEADGGFGIRLYPAYAMLYLQVSGPANYQPACDWYYDIEYPEEGRRGYAFHEDLYTPGYFEIRLRKGQSIVLSAGFEERHTRTFEDIFEDALSGMPLLSSMHEHLLNAGRQFLVENENGPVVRAGYYWFGTWGRDTCISLPGLMEAMPDRTLFKRILDKLLGGVKDGLLPNTGMNGHASHNAADVSLWMIWALQEWVHHTGAAAEVWKEYGGLLSDILDHYQQGTHYGIKMEEDGLISAGASGYALTWMDAIVDGHPVTQRDGKPVEVNALWYNAVCFCCWLAAQAGDGAFLERWQYYPERIRASFTAAFWDPSKGYLADCVHENYKDWSLRPNQLLAVSLPFSPLSPELQEAVMNKINSDLLTPRGLRTLSPEDRNYCSRYGGNQAARDYAYHQGTVWPWLLGHYAAAALRVFKDAALPMLDGIYEGMRPALDECCLHSIAEVYDGAPPHSAGGAVSQAWSVAELLRFRSLVNEYKQQLTLSNGGYTVEAQLPF